MSDRADSTARIFIVLCGIIDLVCSILVGNMLIDFNVNSWTPDKVKQWLVGLRDKPDWIDTEYISSNDYDGRKLLMTTADELYHMGARKVDLQEKILEAIERLRFYNHSISRETLQTATLRLANQSRALQRQLVANRERIRQIRETSSPKSITLSKDFLHSNKDSEKQRVDLDTLAYVSAIVRSVKKITKIISRTPFSKHDDYRSMKSLILALSIEMTSTAQRDQFVERPNDILEKSSKTLADFCDRIVYGTKDMLLIQPFQLKTVRIRKAKHEYDFGLLIRSEPSGSHYIDKILPLSPAKKTNELHEGDEIVYFNRFVTGWTMKNIQGLIDSCQTLSEVTLIVINNPSE